jgi:hypothetical protein
MVVFWFVVLCSVLAKCKYQMNMMSPSSRLKKKAPCSSKMLAHSTTTQKSTSYINITVKISNPAG